MNPRARSCVIRLFDGQREIPGSAGQLSVLMFKRGSLDIALVRQYLRTNRQRTRKMRCASLRPMYCIARQGLRKGTQLIGGDAEGPLGVVIKHIQWPLPLRSTNIRATTVPPADL